jgi:pimeloyl-ACP methyl ester carboxylesterase
MDAPCSRSRPFVLLAIIFTVFVEPLCACADDFDRTVALAREYLASEDRRERRRLAGKLDEYSGDIQRVIDRLSARTYESVEAGYRPQRHFSDP